jgi:hypothetical protein
MIIAAPLDRLTEMSALKEVCRDIAGSLDLPSEYWHFSNFNGVPRMCIDFSWRTGFTMEQLTTLTTCYSKHVTGIIAVIGEFQLFLTRHPQE